MSSILKALRKIEEEKRAEGQAAPDLRMDQGVAPVTSKPFLPLISGVALGAVCVGLFSLWVSLDKPEPANQPQIQPVAVVSDSKQDQPAVAVEPVIRETVPVLVSSVPQQEKLSIKSSPGEVALTEHKSISPKTVKVVPGTDQSAAAEPAENDKVEVPASKVALSAPAIDKKAPPSLKLDSLPVKPRILPSGVSLQVNEIFFQEESANSMAVVNDLPVMVGTHVESAVVVEIRQGTVLFKIGDEVFDVAANSPQ